MKIKPYLLGSIGTNAYLVLEEESGDAMLIDPGAYDAGIDRMVLESGLALKYIVLTHGHGDHTGGVAAFQNSNPDALLAAGASEAELLGDPDMNASAVFGERQSFVPDLLLCEGDELALGALAFRVIETPGHTPGGITLYVSEWDRSLADEAFSGTAFTGDTLFHASIGRTDLPGGDFQTLAASIREKLFTLPADTIVLPGHMDATTIGYERKNNPFVR